MTYVVPICDSDNQDIYIHKVSAKNLQEAEDKVYQYLDREFRLEEELPGSFHEAITILEEYGIYVGNLTDIEIL